jgi:hypothetical protein
MTKRTMILAASLFLASCAEPQPIFKPVEVDIPVVVPCRVAAVPKPDFALAQVTVRDELFFKTKSALIELDQRKAYEAELESRLILCQ